MEKELMTFSHTVQLSTGEIGVIFEEDITAGKILQEAYKPTKYDPYELFRKEIPAIAQGLRAELAIEERNLLRVRQKKPFAFWEVFAEVFMLPDVERHTKALKRIWYGMEARKKNRRLSPQSLADIREKLDMLEVAANHVQLTGNGSERKGRCPFHNERTGSFTVNLEKKVFYCFGCGVKGDIIDFIMKTENLSYQEVQKKYG